MDLKELEGWEGDLDQHWYYAAKAGAMDRMLRGARFSRIADIGAGSGFFAAHLLEYHEGVCEATCVDVNYEKEGEGLVAGKPIRYRRRADGLQADLYLLMDVLEHVEEDVPFLESIVAAARPQARFLLTVPAFAFLWSGHDVYLGHYRRYSLAQIVEVARQAGLVVEKQCYFFGGIFPAVAAVRVVRRLLGGTQSPRHSDMRRFPRALNCLLRGICRIEETVFLMNRAFGLTAMVLARRVG